MDKLTVAVFSFNRGAYLENCLASLQRNMPKARVVVYDDLSDDPATQAVLRQLTVPLVQPKVAAMAQHGGLYDNMARAVADVQTDYLMFYKMICRLCAPSMRKILQTSTPSMGPTPTVLLSLRCS
jgi:glycosyltransferase involved in cell wall biosynthesis